MLRMWSNERPRWYRVPALTIEYLSPVSGISFPVEFYDIGEDGHFWMQWRLAVALRLVEVERASPRPPAAGISTSAAARAASGISSSGPRSGTWT